MAALGTDVIRRHLAALKAAGGRNCMAQLALRGGVSRNTLRLYLLGKGSLRVETLDAILRETGNRLCIMSLSGGSPATDAMDASPQANSGHSADERHGLGDLLKAAAASGFEVRLVPPAPQEASPAKISAAASLQERQEPVNGAPS